MELIRPGMPGLAGRQKRSQLGGQGQHKRCERPCSPGLNVPTTPSTYSAGRYGVSCADQDRDGDMISAMLDCWCGTMRVGGK
jgi:hypothetical protein